MLKNGGLAAPSGYSTPHSLSSVEDALLGPEESTSLLGSRIDEGVSYEGTRYGTAAGADPSREGASCP